MAKARGQVEMGTRAAGVRLLTVGLAVLVAASVDAAALAAPIGLSSRVELGGCGGSSRMWSPCGANAVRPQAEVLTAQPTWINVTASSATSPPLDYWASMAYDPADQEFVLFGGCTVAQCPSPAQTWTFSHGAWSNVTDAGAVPPSRSYATMAYDSSDGHVFLFGGLGSGVLGDTWEFAAGHWVNLTGSVGPGPSARWAASLGYDPVDQGILLFGGMSAQGSILNDTWLYVNRSWRQLTPSAAPPSRYEASLSWDVAESEAVLVSGCGATVCPLNDSWRFANGNWSPLPHGPGPSPGARLLAAMSYDGARDRIRLFGGIRNGVSLGDTWEYAAGAWTQSNVSSSPRAREGSAVPESLEAWLPNGTPVLAPFGLLWGGDWDACPTCRLQGLEDTWAFEVPPQGSVSPITSAAIAGTAVAFHGVASGGTPPFSFSWDFGDGRNVSGSDVSHVFPGPGAYQVRLLVTDDAGARVATAVPVTVVPSQGVSGLAAFLALLFVGVVGLAILVMWVRLRRLPPST